MRISLLCSLVDLRSSRISESDGAGNLVECLTRRIIARAAENHVFAVIANQHKVRVPAADHKADKGRCKLRGCDEIRTDMPLDVMHADQRFPCSEGEPLRRGNTDQKCADQSRPARHRDRVEIVKTLSRRFHCGADDLIDALCVLP